MGPYTHVFHPKSVPDMVNATKFWFIMYLEEGMPDDDDFLRAINTEKVKYLCFVRGVKFSGVRHQTIVGYMELVCSITARKVATTFFSDENLEDGVFNSVQVYSRSNSLPLQGENIIPKIKAMSLKPTTVGTMQVFHFRGNIPVRKNPVQKIGKADIPTRQTAANLDSEGPENQEIEDGKFN
jgi:hypothetical protein